MIFQGSISQPVNYTKLDLLSQLRQHSSSLAQFPFISFSMWCCSMLLCRKMCRKPPQKSHKAAFITRHTNTLELLFLIGWDLYYFYNMVCKKKNSFVENVVKSLQCWFHHHKLQCLIQHWYTRDKYNTPCKIEEILREDPGDLYRSPFETAGTNGCRVITTESV